MADTLSKVNTPPERGEVIKEVDHFSYITFTDGRKKEERDKLVLAATPHPPPSAALPYSHPSPLLFIPPRHSPSSLTLSFLCNADIFARRMTLLCDWWRDLACNLIGLTVYVMSVWLIMDS